MEMFSKLIQEYQLFDYFFNYRFHDVFDIDTNKVADMFQQVQLNFLKLNPCVSLK